MHIKKDREIISEEPRLKKNKKRIRNQQVVTYQQDNKLTEAEKIDNNRTLKIREYKTNTTIN